MPKQSRGFWACDYCHTQFDTFDEARQHELEQCVQNPTSRYPATSTGTNVPASLSASTAAASGTAAGATQQQRSDTYHYPQQSIAQYPYAPSPHYSYPYPPATMAPYSPTDKPHAPQHQQPQSYYGYEHAIPQLRRFPLMEQPQSHLAESDSVTCQNLELFETWDEARNTPQVGIRCLLCARAASTGDKKASQTEYSLPRAIASLADAVRKIADRHLSQCSKVQAGDRQIITGASQRRVASEAERGPSWHEEESDRRMLIDYCSMRCQQLGIVNKLPDNSGIAFQDTISAVEAGPPRYPQHPGYSYDPAMMGVPPHYPPPPSQQKVPSGPAASQQQEYSVTPTQSREQRTPPGHSYPPYGMEQSPQMPMMPVSDPGGYYARHPTYEVPSNFPFYQDPVSGDWLCRYCSHVHPQYRDMHYRWSTPSKAPPPADFLDHHLSLCRSYHQSGQIDYRHAPPSPGYGVAPPPSQRSNVSPPTSAVRSGGPGAQPSAAGMSPMVPVGMASPYHHTSPSPNFAQQAFSPVVLREPDKMEVNARRAIGILTSNDRSILRDDGTPMPIEDQLVRDDDKLLLTDFLFYLMKQLRLVRFSEADRKTRGGKREKINIGFGGLQCVHCAHIPKPRKFFWSGVDRLANSFAEIPAHVFKCKYCHDDVKDALNALKRIHPEQMSRLPRGSQKVFFRRVWKRLHDKDPITETETETLKPPPLGAEGEAPSIAPSASGSPEEKQHSPTGTSGSDESIFMINRPTKEAAKALADSAMQSGPPSPNSRVLLAIPEDKDFLSDTDCFIRKQLEVFCATAEDVRIAREDRKYPIKAGQIGLRCVHCAVKNDGSSATGHAVAYPFSVSGIFESVREFQRLHLEYCENLPPSVRSKLSNLKESTTITSIQRKYYALAAKGLGLRDTKDDGIRAGSESVPVVAQAVFSFTEDSSMMMSEELGRLDPMEGTPPTYSSPQDSRKRSASERDEAHSSDRKKHSPDYYRRKEG